MFTHYAANQPGWPRRGAAGTFTVAAPPMIRELPEEFV